MSRAARTGSAFERALRTYHDIGQATGWARWTDRLPTRWLRRRMPLDGALRQVGPVKQRHYAYAVTTNPRGHATIALIERWRSVAGRDVLDLGCGYGGVLVAAVARGARRAVGLDLDRTLLELARLNLDDQGARARCELLHADVMDADATRDLARFDIINCNDVIEHVADPEALAARIVALLGATGLACIEIPNRRAYRYLAGDPHYQLFGLTALEHDDAEAYFAAVHPGVEYGVGHLHDLARYQQMFEARGCSVEIAPTKRSARALAACDQAYADFARGLDATAPPGVAGELWRRVQARGQAFCDDHRRDRAALAAGTLREDAYRRRYVDGAWRLLVRAGASDQGNASTIATRPNTVGSIT